MALGPFIIALVVLGILYYVIATLVPESPVKKVALVVITILAILLGVVFVLRLLGIPTGRIGNLGS